MLGISFNEADSSNAVGCGGNNGQLDLQQAHRPVTSAGLSIKSPCVCNTWAKVNGATTITHFTLQSALIMNMFGIWTGRYLAE